VVPVPHVPAPSQKAAVVNDPPLHDAAAHSVVAGGRLPQTTETPLHVAAHAPVPSQAARGARGAPVTVLHVPTLPGSAQA
jgi:hypothetical protein